MIEIDHPLLKTADPPPEPARPILASHLYELEEKQRKRFASGGGGERVTTGCGEIDELLGGGFERGILVGISADGNVGRLISLNLLATILISRLSLSTTPQTPKAAIIDTAGSFPLSLLAKVLESRILAVQALSARTANKTANYPSAAPSHANEIGAQVQKCLEMVAISRVFDVEGLWEVLSEVGYNSNHEETIDAGDKNLSNDHEKAKPLEIIDSQDELAISDDEIITSSPLNLENEKPENQGIEVIIIDNMTHIINELFARKEKGDAHTLLSLLSQTLHNLASTQNILTILHNTVVSSKSTYSSTSLQQQESRPRQPSTKRGQPTPALLKSIFPSNAVKPALGQIFAPFPSLHLFLSPLPKSRADAEILYGQDEDSDLLDPDTVEYCTVLEVLKDETPILGADREAGRRFGWREQRWTALEIGEDGVGLVSAFQAKGSRGMELGRDEVGGLTEVGRMAKVYGFGGRRV